MTAPYKKPEINMTKLLERVPNKFLLCVAASRRARQLKDIIHNEGILEEIPTVPVLDALKEIMDGDLIVSVKNGVDELPTIGDPRGTDKSDKSSDPKDDKKGKSDKPTKKSKSLAA